MYWSWSCIPCPQSVVSFLVIHSSYSERVYWIFTMVVLIYSVWMNQLLSILKTDKFSARLRNEKQSANHFRHYKLPSRDHIEFHVNLSIHPFIHLPLLIQGHVSRAASWAGKPRLPSSQLLHPALLAGPRGIPGQPRDMVSPACPAWPHHHKGGGPDPEVTKPDALNASVAPGNSVHQSYEPNCWQRAAPAKSNPHHNPEEPPHRIPQEMWLNAFFRSNSRQTPPPPSRTLLRV